MRGGGNKGYFYESRTKSGINRKNSTDKFNPDCSFPVEQYPYPVEYWAGPVICIPSGPFLSQFPLKAFRYSAFHPLTIPHNPTAPLLSSVCYLPVLSPYCLISIQVTKLLLSFKNPRIGTSKTLDSSISKCSLHADTAIVSLSCHSSMHALSQSFLTSSPWTDLIQWKPWNRKLSLIWLSKSHNLTESEMPHL